MKKMTDLLGAAISVFLLMQLVSQPLASKGWEDAVRIDQGTYVGTRQISLSSTTGTTLWASTSKRPDGTCRFSGTVWISTISATQHNQTHEAISIGLPVYSTETFNLGGSFTGDLFATGDTGVATTKAYCIDSLVR